MNIAQSGNLNMILLTFLLELHILLNLGFGGYSINDRRRSNKKHSKFANNFMFLIMNENKQKHEIVTYILTLKVLIQKYWLSSADAPPGFSQACYKCLESQG